MKSATGAEKKSRRMVAKKDDRCGTKSAQDDCQKSRRRRNEIRTECLRKISPESECNHRRMIAAKIRTGETKSAQDDCLKSRQRLNGISGRYFLRKSEDAAKKYCRNRSENTPACSLKTPPDAVFEHASMHGACKPRCTERASLDARSVQASSVDLTGEACCDRQTRLAPTDRLGSVSPRAGGCFRQASAAALKNHR